MNAIQFNYYDDSIKAANHRDTLSPSTKHLDILLATLEKKAFSF